MAKNSNARKKIVSKARRTLVRRRSGHKRHRPRRSGGGVDYSFAASYKNLVETNHRPKNEGDYDRVIHAPRVLSLVNNAEETSQFIADLRSAFQKSKSVFVVLRDVEQIEYDGLTVLLSVMVRFKENGIDFNGDFPIDGAAKSVINESEFFKHLYKTNFRGASSYKLGKKNSSIHTHANKTVDSSLSASLVMTAAKTIWGEERRCPGVQRTIIELMQNTNNHASPEKEGERHWWLSIKHLQEVKKVNFSFVDYGVGVFESLKQKKSGNKFFGALEALRLRFTPESNLDVLKLVFKGELHKTSSGKSYRGKGLPGMYEAFEKNALSRLVVVTNDVYFNSSENTSRRLTPPFHGTFVHWELAENNHSLHNEN